jgi:hypothetical protein
MEDTCTCPDDCGEETCGNDICCRQQGENHGLCPDDC